MNYHTLRLEKSGHVASVRLRRPEQSNALDRTALEELASAFAAINDDPEAHVGLLLAEGDVFCIGWDVSAFDDGSPLESARRERLIDDSFSFINNCSKPVIAAVQGDAVSAGLELALACDVRIAGESARFALPETSLGLLPMGGGTQRLPRVVGRAKALAMILLGETLDASESLVCGLVSRVVPDERLAAEAMALAQRIADRGPLAVRYAKEAVSRGVEMPLEQALRFETDLTVILQTTEDRAEGVRAFLEKRRPQFKGR